MFSLQYFLISPMAAGILFYFCSAAEMRIHVFIIYFLRFQSVNQKYTYMIVRHKATTTCGLFLV